MSSIARASTVYLTNVRIPQVTGLQCLKFEQGRVAEILPAHAIGPNQDSVIDGQEDWISLGGVDLQINGALGLAFPEVTPANRTEIKAIGEFLWKSGVDAYLPTIVTCAPQQVQTSLQTFADLLPPGTHEAEVWGLHLEGPFLNPEKRGAHPREHLQPLTVDRVKQLLGDYASLVKLVTLAPELDPTGKSIDYLQSLGIIVSLGHSQATAQQAQQAFDRGATMVTHAFNAMPSLHHREPGLLGQAIVDDRVSCGFIADGQHVSPLMLNLLLRASQGKGLFVVSDALAPLGLPDGDYPWDERTITVTQGTARLPDGTLSGTTRGLLEGAKNLVNWGLCDLEQSITLSTITPRLALTPHTKEATSDHCHPTLLQAPIHALLRWRSSRTSSDMFDVSVDRLNEVFIQTQD